MERWKRGSARTPATGSNNQFAAPVMNNGKPILVAGVYMVSLLSKWRRATAVLAERLGPCPHARRGRQSSASCPKKKMGIVAKAIRVNNLTPHWRTRRRRVRGVFDDVLTDEHAIREAETQLIEADDLDRIFEYLGLLEDREATVIRMRFGLDCYTVR